MKIYPDVTELIKQKSRHRRSMAELSFEKKIEIVFKLRERRGFIKSGQVVKSKLASPKSKAPSLK
jgi:hypothetical protein